MVAKISDSTRALAGKQPPNVNKPIKHVLDVGGGKRRVVFTDGTTMATTSKKVGSMVQSVISAKQHAEMKKTQKVLPDGRCVMQIGGLQKGKAKVYKTPEHADKALKRRYGK